MKVITFKSHANTRKPFDYLLRKKIRFAQVKNYHKMAPGDRNVTIQLTSSSGNQVQEPWFIVEKMILKFLGWNKREIIKNQNEFQKNSKCSTVVEELLSHGWLLRHSYPNKISTNLSQTDLSGVWVTKPDSSFEKHSQTGEELVGRPQRVKFHLCQILSV